MFKFAQQSEHSAMHTMQEHKTKKNLIYKQA